MKWEFTPAHVVIDISAKGFQKRCPAMTLSKPRAFPFDISG